MLSPTITLIGAPVQLTGEGWHANDGVVILLSEKGLTPTENEEVVRTKASITGTIQVTFTVPAGKRWQLQPQVRVIAQRLDGTAQTEAWLRISGILFADAAGPQPKPFENEMLPQEAHGMLITSDEDWRAVEAEPPSVYVGERSVESAARRFAPYERYLPYLPPIWLWPYAPSFIPTPTPVPSGLADWDDYVLLGYCLGEDAGAGEGLSILSIQRQGRQMTVVVELPEEPEDAPTDSGNPTMSAPLEKVCVYARVARADLPAGNVTFVFTTPDGAILDEVDPFLPAARLTPADRSNER